MLGGLRKIGLRPSAYIDQLWLSYESLTEPETRAALTADLLDVTKGRATLLITHELRGLDQVDEIVVLEAGKVAGRGTHHKLLRECPLYQQMWDAEQALTG